MTPIASFPTKRRRSPERVELLAVISALRVLCSFVVDCRCLLCNIVFGARFQMFKDWQLSCHMLLLRHIPEYGQDIRSAWEEAVVARVRKEMEVSELRLRESCAFNN